ncbi:hypothetical protein MRX96_028602 [Rhipicephalus microplus]
MQRSSYTRINTAERALFGVSGAIVNMSDETHLHAMSWECAHWERRCTVGCRRDLVVLPRMRTAQAARAGHAEMIQGLCYSELSTRFPKAGSAYVYVYATAGELLAFLVGWALVLEYALAACLSAKALSRHLAALSFSAIRGTS